MANPYPFTPPTQGKPQFLPTPFPFTIESTVNTPQFSSPNPLKRSWEKTGVTYNDDVVASQKRIRYQLENSTESPELTRGSANSHGSHAVEKLATTRTAEPSAFVSQPWGSREAASLVPPVQNVGFPTGNTAFDQLHALQYDFPQAAVISNNINVLHGQYIPSRAHGPSGSGANHGISYHPRQSYQNGQPSQLHAHGHRAASILQTNQISPMDGFISPSSQTTHPENQHSCSQYSPNDCFPLEKYAQQRAPYTTNSPVASKANFATPQSAKAGESWQSRVQKRLDTPNLRTNTTRLVSPYQGLSGNRAPCAHTTQFQTDSSNSTNTTNTASMPYFHDRVIGAVGINPNLHYNPNMRPGRLNRQVEQQNPPAASFASQQGGYALQYPMAIGQQYYIPPPSIPQSPNQAFYEINQGFRNDFLSQQGYDQSQFTQMPNDFEMPPEEDMVGYLQQAYQASQQLEMIHQNQLNAPPGQEMRRYLQQYNDIVQPVFNSLQTQTGPLAQSPPPQHHPNTVGGEVDDASQYDAQQAQLTHASTKDQTGEVVIDLTDDTTDAVSTPFETSTPATTSSLWSHEFSPLTPIDLTVSPPEQSVKPYEKPKHLIHKLQFIDEDPEDVKRMHGYISVAGDQGFDWIGSWIEHEQSQGTFAKDIASKIVFPQYTTADGPCPMTALDSGKPSRKFYELTAWVSAYREKIRISDEMAMAAYERRGGRNTKAAKRKAKKQALEQETAEEARRAAYAAKQQEKLDAPARKKQQDEAARDALLAMCNRESAKMQASRTQQANAVAERRANKVSKRKASAVKSSKPSAAQTEDWKKKEAARLQKIGERKNEAAEKRKGKRGAKKAVASPFTVAELETDDLRDADVDAAFDAEMEGAFDVETSEGEADDDELERAILAEFADDGAGEVPYQAQVYDPTSHTDDAEISEIYHQIEERQCQPSDDNIDDLFSEIFYDEVEEETFESVQPATPVGLVTANEPGHTITTAPKHVIATTPTRKAMGLQEHIDELNNYKPSWKLAEEAAEEAKRALEHAEVAAAAEHELHPDSDAYIEALDPHDYSDLVHDSESEESEEE